MNSPEYLEAVRSHLSHLEGESCYNDFWITYTDTSHFNWYIEPVAVYHQIKGASILDVGSGTGGLLLECLEMGAKHLVGIEVEPDLHQLAQIRTKDTPIQTLLTDGRRIPLAEESFYVIFSVHVIEHTISPGEYIGELARLLKHGGAILLSCPNRVYPHEPHSNVPFISWLPISLSRRLCKQVAASAPPDIKQQLEITKCFNHFISPFYIKRLARNAGLRVLEMNKKVSKRDSVPCGAVGLKYGSFEKAANLWNKLAARGLASSRFFRRLPWFFSWEVFAVLGKN